MMQVAVSKIRRPIRVVVVVCASGTAAAGVDVDAGAGAAGVGDAWDQLGGKRRRRASCLSS